MCCFCVFGCNIDKDKTMNTEKTNNIENDLYLDEVAVETDVDTSDNNSVILQEYELINSSNAIIIDEKNFVDEMRKMYSDHNSYIGSQVVISGFAYDLTILDDNQFMIARYSIDCCADDAIIAGIICTLNNNEKIEFDSWYIIEGTIDEIQYSNEILPQILVNEIRMIDNPNSN